MIERAAFLRSLRFWALHVILGASCSFGVAYGTEWNRPQSIVGMLTGIGIFIVLYAVVWNSAWFRRQIPVGSAWERALVYGTRMRSTLAMSGLVGVLSEAYFGAKRSGAPLVFEPFQMLTLPDFFAGVFALVSIQWLGHTAWVRALRIVIAGTDAHARGQNLFVGDINSLAPTFLITLAQGFILTLMLCLFASMCRLGIRLNTWRISLR